MPFVFSMLLKAASAVFWLILQQVNGFAVISRVMGDKMLQIQCVFSLPLSHTVIQKISFFSAQHSNYVYKCNNVNHSNIHFIPVKLEFLSILGLNKNVPALYLQAGTLMSIGVLLPFFPFNVADQVRDFYSHSYFLQCTCNNCFLIWTVSNGKTWSDQSA